MDGDSPIHRFAYQPHNAALVANHRCRLLLQNGTMSVGEIVTHQLRALRHAEGSKTIAGGHASNTEIADHRIGVDRNPIGSASRNEVLRTRIAPHIDRRQGSAFRRLQQQPIAMHRRANVSPFEERTAAGRQHRHGHIGGETSLRQALAQPFSPRSTATPHGIERNDCVLPTIFQPTFRIERRQSHLINRKSGLQTLGRFA